MNKYLMSTLLVALALIFSPMAIADKQSATQARTEAQALVRSAERNGAQKHAPAALKTARDQMNEGQAYFDDRDWDEAEIAFEKSQRDAELADVKTIALKAEKARDDLRQVVETLRRELIRNGGEV